MLIGGSRNQEVPSDQAVSCELDEGGLCAVLKKEGPSKTKPEAKNHLQAEWEQFSSKGGLSRKKLEDGLKELSVRHGVLVGKWLFFLTSADMDRVWPELVWALSKEALGRADTMKVGSPDQKGKHCCCVYMPNCFDPVQVESAGSHLEALLGGLVTHVDLYLKPDAYTHCKIYRQNPWKLSPSLAVRKVRGSPDPHPQHHDRERDRLASCLQALETKSMEAIARHLEDADSRAELLTSLHGVALQPDGELPLIKICDGLKEAKYLSGLLARIFRVIRGLVDEGAAFMLGYKSRVFSYPEFLRMHVANFDLLGDLCLHGIISDRYVDDKLDSTLFERRGNILPEPSTFAFVMRCFHRLAQKLAHARPHLSRRLEEGMQDYKVPSQAKITILTLNVWREKEQQKLRTAILLSALGKLGATICCFQEVTCTVAVDIQRALPNWSSSDPGDGSSVRGYGNLLLVRNSA